MRFMPVLVRAKVWITDAMLRALSGVFILLISFTGLAAPQRVVSMSLCTDQLLLWLAEPEQVAAVSYLAHDPMYSHFAHKAKMVQPHRADVETIMSLQPDLVLASRFERSQATAMLQRLGVNVVVIDSPLNVDQMDDFILNVANAIGQRDKAQTELAEMQRRLQDLSRVTANRTMLAVSLSANGYQQGRDSLHNQLLHLAGLQTAADRLQWQFDGNLSLEQLVQLQPKVFLFNDSEQGFSLAERWARHPVLRALSAHTRLIELRTADWICPGPWTIDAAMRLQQELKQ